MTKLNRNITQGRVFMNRLLTTRAILVTLTSVYQYNYHHKTSHSATILGYLCGPFCDLFHYAYLSCEGQNTHSPQNKGRGEGRMAEWLRFWTLSHEIVVSSPAIHDVFCA